MAIRLYSEFNLSLTDISSLTGISRSSIYTWIKAEGLVKTPSQGCRGNQSRKKGIDLNILEAAAVGRYVYYHDSSQEISDLIGVTHTNVIGWLKKEGVKVNKEGKLSVGKTVANRRDERIVQALELDDNGYSVKEIAELMDRHPASVRGYLRDGKMERESGVGVVTKVYVNEEGVERMIKEMNRLIEKGLDSQFLLRGIRNILGDIDSKIKEKEDSETLELT